MVIIAVRTLINLNTVRMRTTVFVAEPGPPSAQLGKPTLNLTYTNSTIDYQNHFL